MTHAGKILAFGLLMFAGAARCAAQVPSSQPAPWPPAVAVVHDMTQATALLQRDDPGHQTQAFQSDALEQLSRLLQAARQRSSQSTSQRPSQQQARQDSPQQSPDGPRTGEGRADGSADPQAQGPRSGQDDQPPRGAPGQADRGGDRPAPDAGLSDGHALQPAAGPPASRGRVEAWGFLPPDQRRQVLQGMQAEPPPRYRKLTEHYWRLLNEAGEGR